MTHPVAAAQQELPEAPGLLDLAEHRLDGDLAQPVAAAPSTLFQAPRHGRAQAPRRRGLSAHRRLRAVLLASGGEIATDGAALQRLEVLLTTIAGIGGEFVGQLPRRRLDGSIMGANWPWSLPLPASP